MPGVLLGLAALSLTAQGTRPTAHARNESLAIRSVAPPAEAPRLWSPAELRIDLAATYANPFDPAQVRIDAKIETPSGRSYVQPGFFAQSFSRGTQGEKETLTPEGDAYWALRFTATEPGEHKITVTAQDRSGTTTAKTLALSALPPASASPVSGFLGVSRADRRYFETTLGKAFWPVGTNLAWGGEAGTRDYDKWLPKYSAQGVNLVRLWLSPAWSTFGLERKDLGYGVFDLGNAWRLDYVLNEARSRGIRAQLCLESYNVLRDKDASNFWEEGPHNRRNGGPLDYPGQYWTDPTAEKVALAKMRYVVARYGSDPAVFAWEFWNEADLTRDFPIPAARSWHAKMATALRALDPYGHLITTSFSAPAGVKEIDLLGELDFLQTHAYVTEDIVNPVAVQQSRKGGWGKPHLLGEVGADYRGPTAKDLRGYEVHDPLWAAIGTASSGSSMAWWWDTGTDPKGWYPLYGALSRFVEGIDFPREGFRQTRPGFGYLDNPKTLPLGDISINAGAASWEANAFNRPRTVTVTEGGADRAAPSLLHGTSNHTDLHNPVIFATNLPRKTRFDVLVGDVSGYGGGKLVVRLNGDAVMTRDFADPDGVTKNDTLTGFAGVYSLEIPAGKHRIEVENTGKDWFIANFRFRGAVVQKAPALDA